MDTRLSNLDIFRAIAALSVCFFHFDQHNYVGQPWVDIPLSYGFYGVHIFFVISGFVIPLSIANRMKTIADFKRFMVSRFFRLYPAYVASIILTLSLLYLSLNLTGKQELMPNINLPSILAHLTLTNDLFGISWYSVIYWTLGIEAQYYLLIALTIPALIDESRLTKYAAVLLWIIPPVFFGVGVTIFSWGALFGMGILTFMVFRKLIPRSGYFVLLLLAALIHGYAFETTSALIGLTTALGISYLPVIQNRFFIWIGVISYSLYLIHVPIGTRTISMFQMFDTSMIVRFAALFVAAGASIFAAWIFYLVIEKPSHRHASAKRSAKTQTNKQLSS